jgi:hypothetical protein
VGNFEDGLAQLDVLKRRRQLAPAGELSRALSPERLAGATFHVGDRVRNPRTREEGTVVRVRFVRETSAPTP